MTSAETSSRHRRTIACAALVMTAAILLSRAWFAVNREFGPDELEHAHATWALSRGQIPYLDYFEHHTPWLYMIFAPAVRLFPTDTDPAAAASLLISWRFVMWLMTIAIVAAVYWLGTSWRDRFTGVLAALFVVSADFLQKTLEIRPDVPALVCFTLALLAAMAAFRSAHVSGAAWRFLLSGLATGAALMFTQKYLFAGPGLACMLAAFIADPRGPGSPRARAGAAAAFALGSLVPVAATAAWFASHQALDAFVHYNVTANLRFNESRFSSAGTLAAITITSPTLFVLGFAGFLLDGRRYLRGGAPRDRPVLLFTAASLFVGLFIMPVPFAQFFLMFMPHLAVFQAVFVQDAVAWLRRQRPAAGWMRPGVAMAALAVPVVHGTGALIVSFTPNTAQLDQIRYVMEHTAPDESVLDGFSGYGAFRPHAWFFFFLGTPIMTDADNEAFEARLRSGEVRPKIVLFDAHVAALPAGIVDYIEAHYEPGPGLVRVRVRD